MQETHNYTCRHMLESLLHGYTAKKISPRLALAKKTL